MKHIIGLGNPDVKYLQTRHNMGWIVLDALAGTQEWKLNSKKHLLYVWLDDVTELIKPTTYMNKSGKALRDILKKHPKTTPNDIIVVHDEVDLAFGAIKISRNVSAAGHNGVKSIIETLGSQDFIRIRVGVGKSEIVPTEQFVLQNFTADEVKSLDDVVTRAARAVRACLTQPLNEVQNSFH